LTEKVLALSAEAGFVNIKLFNGEKDVRNKINTISEKNFIIIHVINSVV
jgi:hypothetical protein